MSDQLIIGLRLVLENRSVSDREKVIGLTLPLDLFRRLVGQKCCDYHLAPSYDQWSLTIDDYMAIHLDAVSTSATRIVESLHRLKAELRYDCLTTGCATAPFCSFDRSGEFISWKNSILSYDSNLIQVDYAQKVVYTTRVSNIQFRKRLFSSKDNLSSIGFHRAWSG